MSTHLVYGSATWHDGQPREIPQAEIATEVSRHENAGLVYITAEYPDGRQATWPESEWSIARTPYQWSMSTATSTPCAIAGSATPNPRTRKGASSMSHIKILSQPDLRNHEMEKRFKLPGLKIAATCNCGATTTIDWGGDDYLSYPKGEGTETAYWECEKCEEENEVAFSYSIRVVCKVI